MPSHVLVNGLGLTYKSTVGISTATIPDVCKTPSPGGPVPIPYPNFADQSSLKSGTTTVKAKGKMIAVKGSQYSRSNGDEAGTAGGVKSSVNMKATDWITYSFDVKMDGKNACRHTDKKFHNNQNTVDLAGNIDPSAPLAGLEDIAEECNKDVNKREGYCPPPPSGTDCTRLGTLKHKCCEDAIKEQDLEHIEAEKPYKKVRKKPPKYKPREAYEGPSPREQAAAAYEKAIADRIATYTGSGSAAQQRAAARRYVRNRNVYQDALRKARGGDFIADVVKFEPPPKEAYDFKFNCQETGDNPERFMSSDQKQKYKDALGVEPQIIHKDGRQCK